MSTSTASLAASFASFAPYAFPGYFLLLGMAYALKGKVPVPRNVEFAHNMFLTFQSAGLMLVITLLYRDAHANNSEEVFSFPKTFTHSIQNRVNSKYFDFALICFLSSKVYEALDTVLLILNGKSLLLLHVWHHATTYVAFYTGLFTGAGYWIGMLNSFIHVIMYMYYARIAFIKPLAKYITSLQITHLFGGVLLNAISFFSPVENVGGSKEYAAAANCR